MGGVEEMNIYHFHLLLLLLFLLLLLLLGFGCDGEHSGGYLPESRELFLLRPNRRRADAQRTHLTIENINLFTHDINNTSSSHWTLSKGCGTRAKL